MKIKVKEIENTQSAVDCFQLFFAKEVIRPLFPEKDDADVAATLLNESLGNAWEHGNRKDPEKRIRVQWEILDGGGLKVSVRDDGAGFVPPAHPEVPPITQKRGRGIIIIQEFADSLSFNEQGTEITFTFKGEKKDE